MGSDGFRATVVFDLDGTLIDSAPDLGGALNDVLGELGRLPVPLAEVRTMVGEGALAMLRAGLEATGGTEGIDLNGLRPRFLELYSKQLARQTCLYPQAKETLNTLESQGCRLSVCTNKPEGLAREVLAEMGILDRFASLVGGDTLSVRKPDPEVLLHAVVGAGGDMKNAVMVGDSSTDVVTARNAGIPVIAVSFGYTRIPPGDLGANVLVDGLGEISGVLAELGILG